MVLNMQNDSRCHSLTPVSVGQSKQIIQEKQKPLNIDKLLASVATADEKKTWEICAVWECSPYL